MNRSQVMAVSAALFLAAQFLQADPPSREGLPPGLQKKEKLPPGWQKKAGKKGKGGQGETPEAAATNATGAAGSPAGVPATTPATVPATKGPEAPQNKAPETAKTPTPSTTTPASTTPGSTTASTPSKALTRQQRENLARMERALTDLEKQAARPAATERLLQRLSNRQNIPLGTLQTQLKNNPGLTVPQLYLATLIAREARVPNERILQERKSGTSWADIALSHKVPYSDLAERLRAAEDAAKDAANAEQSKVRKAERTN